MFYTFLALFLAYLLAITLWIDIPSRTCYIAKILGGIRRRLRTFLIASVFIWHMTFLTFINTSLFTCTLIIYIVVFWTSRNTCIYIATDLKSKRRTFVIALQVSVYRCLIIIHIITITLFCTLKAHLSFCRIVSVFNFNVSFAIQTSFATVFCVVFILSKIADYLYSLRV